MKIYTDEEIRVMAEEKMGPIPEHVWPIILAGAHALMTLSYPDDPEPPVSVGDEETP